MLISCSTAAQTAQVVGSILTQVRFLESKVKETRLQVAQQMGAMRAAANAVEPVCHDSAVQVGKDNVPAADACAEQLHGSESNLISTIKSLQAELGRLRASSQHLMKLYRREQLPSGEYAV
jgi:hypothetical protein